MHNRQERTSALLAADTRAKQNVVTRSRNRSRSYDWPTTCAPEDLARADALIRERIAAKGHAPR